MSPTIIPEGMTIETAIRDFINTLSPNLQAKAQEALNIKEMAKDLESSANEAGTIIRNYKDARTRLRNPAITVEGGIDILEKLLNDTHKIASDEAKRITSYKDALGKVLKNFARATIETTGYGAWISCMPNLIKILESCKADLVSIRKDFDRILDKYKRIEKNPKYYTNFRNEFKKDVINKMKILCENVQDSFKQYANHKITVEEAPSTGDALKLTSAQQCLISYIRVISGYAGIKRLKELPTPTGESTIFREKAQRGPGGIFGHGIVALMFESICNGMISKSAHELGCDEADMKKHIYDAYEKRA